MDILGVHGGHAWHVHRHDSSVFETFAPSDLVYLSPDADDVLEVSPFHPKALFLTS
jgi:hypothetical protein